MFLKSSTGVCRIRLELPIATLLVIQAIDFTSIDLISECWCPVAPGTVAVPVV